MSVPNIQIIKLQYPYTKPKRELQIYLLSGLIFIGLIALGLAAFNAFHQIAGVPQALAAALLIEVGLVIESMTLIKHPKSIFPWGALLVAYTVSGTYNYTQAQKAGASLNEWQLITLSLGPLSALAFISLTLGNELREYDRQAMEWEEKRAEWAEGERRRLENKAEMAERRKERQEEKYRQRQEQSENLPESSGNLPPWLPVMPRNLTHFKNMIDSGEIILPPGLTGADLQQIISSIGTDRTGRNWLQAVDYREMTNSNGHKAAQ
jgi:hypothetical protein